MLRSGGHMTWNGAVGRLDFRPALTEPGIALSFNPAGIAKTQDIK